MADAEAQPALSRSDAAAARIGSTVDKYTLVRLLGRGGMGAVYEARHAKLSRRFAIKFLLPEFAANRDVLRRFENEAKAAGGLEHPNLAAVTDFGQAVDGAPYIVMEFLQGEDGAKLLRRNGPLPIRRAADLIIQACRGLAVAHRAGIVHRDLKPENIFLTDAGDGRDQVKVLDFGIAKLRTTDASVATGTGATFGTAYYMSPEQARGAGEVDHRSDVWSLGVVLFELLSGRKPFEGGAFLEVVHKILSTEAPALDEARPGLPPRLVAVVRQAMRKDLLERIPSVLALADALAPFAAAAEAAPPSGLAATAATAETQATPVTVAPVAATPVTAAPVTATASAGATHARRSRAPLTIGVVALGLAIAAALAFLARAPQSASAPPPPTAAAAPPPAPATEPAPVAPAPAAAPASAPAAAASTAAPAPTSASGHASEPRPNKRTGSRTPRFEPPASRLEPPAPATPAPNPAPVAAPPRAGHPIDIEKDNPYGN
jgi:serine/threonine-protein kinase